MSEHEVVPETPLQAVSDYAIELTDRLANEYPEGFEIGEIIIVTEVKPTGGAWEVQSLSSDERPYVAQAMLAVAAASALTPDIPDEPD